MIVSGSTKSCFPDMLATSIYTLKDFCIFLAAFGLIRCTHDPFRIF